MSEPYKVSLKAHHRDHIAEFYDEIHVDVFEELRVIVSFQAIFQNFESLLATELSLLIQYSIPTGHKCGLPIFIFDVINLDNAAIKSYERK